MTPSNQLISYANYASTPSAHGNAVLPWQGQLNNQFVSRDSCAARFRRPKAVGLPRSGKRGPTNGKPSNINAGLCWKSQDVQLGELAVLPLNCARELRNEIRRLDRISVRFHRSLLSS